MRLRDLRDAVDDCGTFEEKEQYIEGLSIHAELKSALWLWAWSHQSRRHQRAITASFMNDLDLREKRRRAPVPMA